MFAELDRRSRRCIRELIAPLTAAQRARLVNACRSCRRPFIGSLEPRADRDDPAISSWRRGLGHRATRTTLRDEYGWNEEFRSACRQTLCEIWQRSMTQPRAVLGL